MKVCLGALAVAVRPAAKSRYVPVSIDQWTQSLPDLQYQLKMFLIQFVSLWRGPHTVELVVVSVGLFERRHIDIWEVRSARKDVAQYGETWVWEATVEYGFAAFTKMLRWESCQSEKVESRQEQKLDHHRLIPQRSIANHLWVLHQFPTEPKGTHQPNLVPSSELWWHFWVGNVGALPAHLLVGGMTKCDGVWCQESW